MLIPRRVKHRKQHRPKRSGNAKGGTAVAFGDFTITGTVDTGMIILMLLTTFGLSMDYEVFFWEGFRYHEQQSSLYLGHFGEVFEHSQSH